MLAQVPDATVQVLVGERQQVLGELAAWSAHRAPPHRGAHGDENQLLSQLDRAFPGLTLVLPDVLGTKAGRLIAEHLQPLTSESVSR